MNIVVLRYIKAATPHDCWKILVPSDKPLSGTKAMQKVQRRGDGRGGMGSVPISFRIRKNRADTKSNPML